MDDISTRGLPTEIAASGRILMLAAVVASLLYNAEYIFFRKYDPFALDFKVFWTAAHSASSGIYAPSDETLVYPPTALLFFKPLELVAYIPGYLVLSFLSAGAFLLAATRLANVRIAAISLLSAGALQGLALGQISMLLGAAVLFAVSAPPLWCGVIIGLVGSIKPQLVCFAPIIFLFRRDWMAIVGFAVAVALCIAAELMIFGPRIWINWLEAIPAFKETLIRIDAIKEVIAPSGVAERMGMELAIPWSIATVIAIGASFLVAKQARGMNFAALIVGCSIFVAPYALRHDTIALVPAFVSYILTRPGLRSLPAWGIFSGLYVPLSMVAIAVGVILKSKFDE